MINHTPGPWVVIEGRFAWTIGKWPYRIAEISNVAEYKANARLIAAAPDLLEALEQIAWSNDSKWQADCARAAIKKATGEK